MTLIVHVTESLGGGVLYSIAQLAKAQADSGLDVVLVHSRRLDTPSASELQALFPLPIKRVELLMARAIAPINDLLSVLRLRRLFRRLKPDVIHLHSSKAGALGRLAVLLCGIKCQVVYSPRGFAFLRSDVSTNKQRLFLAIERIMSRMPGILVACSETEAKLARQRVGHPDVRLVENSIDLSCIKSASFGFKPRIRIVTSGRMTYAKAPWRFRKLAICLAHKSVDFVWIGGGENIDSEWRLVKEISVTKDLNFDSYGLPDGSAATLTATGWLRRDQVLNELAEADIFVMTSLWEGMPLSLIEAQAAGLPAVVPDVIGCRDVVRSDVTGYVCVSDDELAQRVQDLIDMPELRRRLGGQASHLAAGRFGVSRMHTEMLRVYGILQ